MEKFKEEYGVLNKYFNFLDINKFFQYDDLNLNSKTYFVQNKQNKFILKYIPGEKIRPRLNKMCMILSFCKKQNIAVQEPIESISEGFVLDNHYFLTKYYSGTYFDGTDLELSNFAKNLALLHKVLSKIKISYNFEPFRESYKILKKTDLVKIKNIINKKENQKTIFDRMFLDNFSLLESSFSDIAISEEYYKSGKQLIHFDLHPGNVIFNNHRVSAIIDFGSMRKGYLIDDVAFSSFRFASYGTKNPKKIVDKMEYFFNMYTKFNPLPELFSEFPKIAKLQILKRLSFILRNYYYTNTSFWISDMKNQLEFISLLEKIINKLKN